MSASGGFARFLRFLRFAAVGAGAALPGRALPLGAVPAAHRCAPTNQACFGAQPRSASSTSMSWRV